MRLAIDTAADPVLGAATTEVLLRAVGAGTEPATLRITTPGRAVAFGRRDAARQGYAEAVRAVSGLGFRPLLRLAGGTAATLHEDTLAITWFVADARPQEGVQARYRLLAGTIAKTLRGLGVQADIGEVPGEYCPGAWSVNVGGSKKLMGVGQRVVRGAALVGALLVVNRPDLVNLALAPAYEALGYDYDPDATGSVGDFVPGVTSRGLASEIASAFGDSGMRLDEAPVSGDVVQAARDLASDG